MLLHATPLPATDPVLLAMLEKARFYKMTPAEVRAQRRSWILGEAAMGSDADEAAYRSALAADDTAELARLDAEATARRERAAATLDRMGL